jgi:hypothetical protein
MDIAGGEWVSTPRTPNGGGGGICAGVRQVKTNGKKLDIFLGFRVGIWKQGIIKYYKNL